MFSTLFGYWAGGGGGGLPRIGAQPAYTIFHPGQLEKLKFSKLVFMIVCQTDMTIQGM